MKEIRIHDPLVVSDPKLSNQYPQVFLTSDLNKAVQDDLVFLVADHPEYSSLTQEKFDGVPIYDGRGILHKTKSFDSRLKTIGVENS